MLCVKKTFLIIKQTLTDTLYELQNNGLLLIVKHRVSIAYIYQ